MIKIYGSMFCPDCVKCRQDLDGAGVKFEYLDFADSLWNLKCFLDLRDHHPAFEEVRQQGKIGIPCIVREDGAVSLDWKDLLEV